MTLPNSEQCYELLAHDDWRTLVPRATDLREQGWGMRVSYSRKVFVPLTQLCRDVCHYCTFAKTPSHLSTPYLTPDDVLRIVRDGAALGCKEVLFTLGDQPELRYARARDALAELGFQTTLTYLEHVAALVLRETGLLPHLNPGLMNAEDLARLRRVAPSMGIMLESASERLCERGGPHFGSPDKVPSRRLDTLRLAGEARIPMTSGILIGIGETRRERIDALLALRDLSDRYGHLQEIIIQNFRAKPGTKMQHAPEPSTDDLCWTIAVARLMFGARMSIQAPPNLYGGDLTELIAAGINDWGGVSPLTPDHVNPEAPWPHLDRLAAETSRAGCDLVERLTVYPSYVRRSQEWLVDELRAPVLKLSDGAGWARVGRWCAGAPEPANADDLRDVPSSAMAISAPSADDLRDIPSSAMATSAPSADDLRDVPSSAMAILIAPHLCNVPRQVPAISAAPQVLTCATPTSAISSPPRRSRIAELAERAAAGHELIETEIAEFFTARGADFARLCRVANEVRHQAVGDTVSYAVVRNINYTNVCLYKCGFCAFSKGRTHEHLRGAPYLVDLDEIRRRVSEAWERGGTEVCMQGGIHPSFTGHTYLEICRAAKQAQPQIHIHAFSPLEVSHGAQTLGISVQEFLIELKQAGLGSLPGTAAEILDDDIRRALAPDKLSTREWLDVVVQAHQVGLPTTSTIMFGHIEGYEHWARHLLLLRRLQQETGGLTEFVPLPFVHMEAPMYLRGRARRGPTLRETLLMHAVARLALHPVVPNVQVSWVKLGPLWAQRCLEAGANDLGGTLMNESISRAAGATHGQELEPRQMQQLITELGRPYRQRTTLYANANAEQIERARCAAPLTKPYNAPVSGKSMRVVA
ncbi:bifunctional FO biosynthesis protein CofGH [Steroidobacter flavus]|uniref:FO synthase n=1 Tax=Steroidobacter flavus TaxID=1842136 RepID=A0ABV8T741_9GAMM